MYKNYGDVDFFQRGVLVEADNNSPTTFHMLRCEPYTDQEDLFQFASVYVDISDTWIDKDRVLSNIGMTEADFDPLQFAIGCTDCYSWDNFGALDYSGSYDWQKCTREQVEEQLKAYGIDLEEVA